ncbi:MULTISPECIES: S8 family peptidase [Enterococcus]|uniref:S8 family peptidase n=1 Tax=Enterococcus xiangfangensis TaxID=1296537 RepID=A0ABU3F8R3_9ENTE|nr:MULTISPECIES: S8 family peptidase [Enterococcus]EGO9405415.1 serine protease [Enterococcus faecalis]MDT2398108.1 S8 family peptidase [Enterococcus avium]MDT2486565.1 S8 family peptidase [Enterococcus avium]MDT2517888.1 S8 family peptidase [Enterococcus avium]MDT2758860.1 S8 family peptidase [Enterococcus xiangfangensis]
MANNVLELRGKRFVQAARNITGGGASMNSKKVVTTKEILRLQNKMEQIRNFWLQENRPFNGVLISVHYNKIVAKSNRIGGLLKGRESDLAVVGAKFNDTKTKHIITYYVSDKDLEKSIKSLQNAMGILNNKFNGQLNKAVFDDYKKMNSLSFNNSIMSKSLFKQVIADISYIDDFEIELASQQSRESIITLYDTKIETKSLLKKLGIEILPSRIIDDQTIFLNESELELLFEKAPYLVSMATTDLSELSPSDFNQVESQRKMFIPDPTIEPTIGVIDTLFDNRVYFNKWVDYHEKINKNYPKDSNDYRHGTAVSSIIVDGPRLNPWLEDNCGRFKVRHFGVAAGKNFSSFTIIKRIKEIIMENRDIRVWNISLGSNQEINDNFISAEAAVLDQIQYQYDVIFVIAGTNKPNEKIHRIGSPADSINSMVVNSVTKDGLSTRYARRGIALSFFAKPDVSYYGGSKEQYIRVCEPLGEANVAGTSFAAPWISRKLSYLIDTLGLNREIAKALIIDAAKGWNDKPTPEEISLYGHGTVPIKIDDIIKSSDEEIKFLVTDISEKWNTYNYSFPIPLQDDKYPYIARATMCYFPICNRTQGVDYTNTELNIHFGRIKDDGKINDIKGDKQNQEEDLNTEKYYLLEGEARLNFRKWDNVKYVAEMPKNRMRPKKAYEISKNWGMEIKTNNRLDPKDGVGLRFGVVITIKEINGVNRIDEFVKNCYLNGWIVNELDIQVKQDIHKKLNEDIEFQ